MARFLFRLPDIGEGITQAEIVTWHVKVGERIAEDQSLLDVMTDKATVDMTSPVAGVVMATHGEPGELVAVGATLVEFEIEGDGEQSAPVQPEAATTATAKPVEAKTAEAKSTVAAPVDVPKRESRARTPDSRPLPVAVTAEPLASPAVRRRAYELGIPLQFVPGTAAAGRITEQDLQDYIDGRSCASTTGRRYEKRTGVRDTKLIGLRRRIAEKMQESKRRIPHFGYVEEFDMTELEALRRELNEERDESRPKLTLLPFFMRAVVSLVPEFPQFNARYDDEAGVLQMHDGVHIGIATQSSQGLLVPVVRHAEARDLWDCARELRRVTSAARDGTATRDELSGSTITLTSLGALGGISATPVINHPEVAIIGPNKLVERPVVRGGRLEFRLLMNVSCAFDHRIIDGHEAARFVQRMRRLIERPAHLFVD